MIALKKITWDNYKEICDLEIHEHQKKYVDSNLKCLAKAYIDFKTTGAKSFEYGIYASGEPIGFVMLEYKDSNKSLLPDKSPFYIIWEFMIDKNHQGKGLGRSAMIKIIEHLKTRPEGDAKSVIIPYEPENLIVSKLYASLGFEKIDPVSSDKYEYIQLKF